MHKLQSLIHRAAGRIARAWRSDTAVENAAIAIGWCAFVIVAAGKWHGWLP